MTALNPRLLTVHLASVSMRRTPLAQPLIGRGISFLAGLVLGGIIIGAML